MALTKMPIREFPERRTKAMVYEVHAFESALPKRRSQIPYKKLPSFGRLICRASIHDEPLKEKSKALASAQSSTTPAVRVSDTLSCHKIKDKQPSCNVHGRKCLMGILWQLESTTTADIEKVPTTSSTDKHPTTKKSLSKPQCIVKGCCKVAQSNRRCISHGGGVRCQHENCMKSAVGSKSNPATFCIKHGGGRRCGIEGCAKSAQQGGKCFAHGGGTRCKKENCDKSAKRLGLCVAHGGGRQCSIPSCTKHAKKLGYCTAHYKTISKKK